MIILLSKVRRLAVVEQHFEGRLQRYVGDRLVAVDWEKLIFFLNTLYNEANVCNRYSAAPLEAIDSGQNPELHYRFKSDNLVQVR